MMTLKDKATRNEVITRINCLDGNSKPLWGKMDVYQMLKHCTLWDEMALGKTHYKQSFIGRIFGQMALKGVLKDDTPLGRNTPTIPEFKVVGSGNAAHEKDKWVVCINEYGHLNNPNFIHPFFGSMTEEQIGIMAYKHADHHLRQFNS